MALNHGTKMVMTKMISLAVDGTTTLEGQTVLATFTPGKRITLEKGLKIHQGLTQVSERISEGLALIISSLNVYQNPR